FAATNLRARVAYLCRLIADAPDRALEELRKAMAEWVNQGTHLQHYFELLAFADIAHYTGKPQEAWDMLQSRWRPLKQAFVLYVQSNRITMHHLRARAALALAEREAQGRARDRFLTAAAADAGKVRRERMGGVTPVGGPLDARGARPGRRPPAAPRPPAAARGRLPPPRQGLEHPARPSPP